jgi:DNA-3-methyladenine glycosylase II
MRITAENSQQIGRRIVKIEPRFKEVVSKFGPAPIGVRRPTSSNFESLADSILSQQLSTKAAATIVARVALLSGGRLDATEISSLPTAQLRKAGCSENKARALLELSRAVTSGELPLRSLSRKDDQEIMEILLPYYGIGRWTVEMFLIFQLGRLDIWPTGDLGVRRGWEKVYKMKRDVEVDELEELGSRFAPYRSHLAWYCWRAHSLY